MAQVERGVSVGAAIGVVVVVLGLVTAGGLFVGEKYFWRPADSRNIVQKRFDATEEAYKKAPKSKDAKLAYAIIMGQQGNVKVAEKLLRELEDKFPKDASVLANIAIFYKDTKRMDKAEEYFKRLEKVAPHYFVANVHYGIMLREQGKYSEALQKLDDALTVNPGAADVLLEKAKVFIAQKDSAKAKETLNKVLAYLPDNTEAEQLLKELK